MPIDKILSVKNTRSWVSMVSYLKKLRQLLKGSQDFNFSLICIFIFICFIKYETIETHARAFLTLDILAILTLDILAIGRVAVI